MTLSVSIIGNGAIGGLLKARCQQWQIPFNVLTRRQGEKSLMVSLFDGTRIEINQSSQTIDDGTIHDLVISPVKAYQVETVLQELSTKLLPSTCLVLLHNGMGSREIIERLLPNQPVVLATTSHAAYNVSSNTIKQTGIGQSQFGWLNTADLTRPMQQNIEYLLSKLLQPSTLLADMQLALWKKLAVNAAINPLTAIFEVKNGELKAPFYQPIIGAICQEVSIVALAHGQKITADELLKNTEQVINDTAQNYSSMYQDVKAKRRTEIDSISGYILARASEANLKVPENQTWFNKIKTVECRYLLS
jgi:2-dehydropantoate 2-reductase